MTIIHILVGLIDAILKVIASVLLSGIGLLVTALTAVLIVIGLSFAGVSGFGALRIFRKRKAARNAGGPDKNA